MDNNQSNKENLDQYQSAYKDDFKFNDENMATLDWYSKRMCADMRRNKAANVLSLGIGHRIVSRNISEEFSYNLKRHLILEGSQQITND